MKSVGSELRLLAERFVAPEFSTSKKTESRIKIKGTADIYELHLLIYSGF